MTVSPPPSLRGRLRALVETSLPLAVCVVNPRRFQHKDFEQAILGAEQHFRARKLRPRSSSQAREGLRDSREGQVPEVVKPPQPFAAALDLLTDESHDPA